METGIHNTSEIGQLRKVLLHRPGQELENLMPEYLERLLFDLSGCDGARVARFMGDLAGKKRYAIDEAMKAALQKRYFAGCVDEAGVRAEIRRTWEEDH